MYNNWDSGMNLIHSFPSSKQLFSNYSRLYHYVSLACTAQIGSNARLAVSPNRRKCAVMGFVRHYTNV